jgi:hypothetical protein
MNESTFKGPWWLWWCNPLMDIHEDHKFYFRPRELDLDKAEGYGKIQSIRNALQLSIIPEFGLINEPFYGLWAFLNSEHCKKIEPRLQALTFDDGILTLNTKDWDLMFGINNSEHVKSLISFKKKIPNTLAAIVSDFVSDSGNWRAGSSLTMFERLLLVGAVFYRNRFPEFFKRWILTQPNSVVKSVDKVCTKHSSESLDNLCNFLELEIKSIINVVLEDFKIDELNFDSEFDELNM